MKFPIGAIVRRDPKVWKKESTLFVVVAHDGDRIRIQKQGQKPEPCVWTGKLVMPTAQGYLPCELRSAA